MRETARKILGDQLADSVKVKMVRALSVKHLDTDLAMYRMYGALIKRAK